MSKYCSICGNEIIGDMTPMYENEPVCFDCAQDIIDSIDDNETDPRYFIDTTEHWAEQTDLIPSYRDVIIFSDAFTVNGRVVPGIKLGDGETVLSDLPFITYAVEQELEDHENDTDVHVTPDERSRWNLMTYYGVCNTAASTQTKTVTINGITELVKGLSVRIKFSNAQSYNGTPKFDLNGLGAKSIYRDGINVAGLNAWAAGALLDLCYAGSVWIIVNSRV